MIHHRGDWLLIAAGADDKISNANWKVKILSVQLEKIVMDNAGLKIAILLVVVVAIVLVAGKFMRRPVEPAPQPTGFSDVVAKDDKRLRANVPVPVKGQSEGAKTPAATEQARQTLPAAEQVTLYFTELSEIDKIEAERLLNVAVPGRSIGRLPMTGFKLMVDSCRLIIEQWPDSWYAYRAKQMLAEMPERFRERYGITAEELDVKRFAEPRPGTKAFVIKESD